MLWLFCHLLTDIIFKPNDPVITSDRASYMILSASVCFRRLCFVVLGRTPILCP